MPLLNLAPHALPIFLVPLTALLQQLLTMARAPQMALQILPATVGFKRASGLRTAVGPQRLVRALVFAQVTRVRAGEVAEAAFVRFLALVKRGDVGLELRVRGRGVAAAVAHVGALAGVRALVVVFGLVGGEGFATRRETACVGAVAGVAEEVARELGALLEVLGAGVAAFPLAEAGRAVVNVRSLGVFMKRFGGGKGGEAEDVRGVLPVGG